MTDLEALAVLRELLGWPAVRRIAGERPIDDALQQLTESALRSACLTPDD